MRSNTVRHSEFDSDLVLSVAGISGNGLPGRFFQHFTQRLAQEIPWGLRLPKRVRSETILLPPFAVRFTFLNRTSQ